MFFLRALLAFLALPAVVAFLVPLLLLPEDRWRMEGTIAGWPVLAFGLLVLLTCVHDFYVFGKGTLAPWDPPRKLVTGGLYGFVRNPMYVGVVGIVAGGSLIAGSFLLGAYAVFLAGAFHLRVVLYEEPKLAHQFPADWRRYRSGVNRCPLFRIDLDSDVRRKGSNSLLTQAGPIHPTTLTGWMASNRCAAGAVHIRTCGRAIEHLKREMPPRHKRTGLRSGYSACSTGLW
jgi:protein-S-isoprenylcysteine O-methyltransferase Ste14